MSRRTQPANAFQTTLASAIVAGSTSIQLTSATGLGDSDYLIIDPFSPTTREVIKYTSKAGDIISGLTRGLTGSAGGTAHDHAGDTIVISTPTAQLISDIFSDVEDLEQADVDHVLAADPHPGYVRESVHLAGSPADPHPQYVQDSIFVKATIDAMGIDAATLNTRADTDFALAGHTHTVVPSHTHTGVYAPVSHSHSVATPSTGGTGGSDGFMSAQDKEILDNLDAGGGNQTIVAGTALDGGGSGSTVTVNHADQQASATSKGPLVSASVISQIGLDGLGHVNALNTRNLTAADIGAAASGHAHSAFTALSITNDLTVGGTITDPSYGAMLRADSDYTKLTRGSRQLLYGDGTSATFMDNLPYGSQAYVMHIVESGVSRQLYYFAVASSRRFKENIIPVIRGEGAWEWILGLVQSDFTYIADPESQPKRFYIAEELHTLAVTALGPEVAERYIERDSDGEIVNISEKALLSEVIVAVGDLHDRLSAVEAHLGL